MHKLKAMFLLLSGTFQRVLRILSLQCILSLQWVLVHVDVFDSRFVEKDILEKLKR